MDRTHLAYCNFVDTRIYGIEFELPSRGPDLRGLAKSSVRASAWPGQQFGPMPGWFAISVNFVKGIGFSLRALDGTLASAPIGAYSYFQLFKPLAKAGYSIFVYHDTLKEANRARRQLGLKGLSE